MNSDPVQLLMLLVPLLLLAGAAAGMLAGLLGVGGGIVIVPALFHIFAYLGVDDSVKMHLAVGTSLATIIPTGIRSMRAHQVRGSFDMDIFLDWIPAMVLGVLLGSWLASLADTFLLTLIFGVVALLVSLQMAFGSPNLRLADSPPAGPAKWLIAGSIGTVSAMMGIGGGTLSVPSLNMHGVPMHRAVGTSAGFGLIIALAGTLGFIATGWDAAELPAYSIGFVNWMAFLAIVPATILFVPVGASLAHKLSHANLRRVFALFLAVTAIRMLGDVSGVI
jgi:uncharacterized membrane protein YfcA